MCYGSIYLVVKDFDQSVSFYKKVLDMEVSAVNGKRFAMFNYNGLNLCIMNGYFDCDNKETLLRLQAGIQKNKYGKRNTVAESVNWKRRKLNWRDMTISSILGGRCHIFLQNLVEKCNHLCKKRTYMVYKRLYF